MMKVHQASLTRVHRDAIRRASDEASHQLSIRVDGSENNPLRHIRRARWCRKSLVLVHQTPLAVPGEELDIGDHAVITMPVPFHDGGLEDGPKSIADGLVFAHLCVCSFGSRGAGSAAHAILARRVSNGRVQVEMWGTLVAVTQL